MQGEISSEHLYLNVLNKSFEIQTPCLLLIVAILPHIFVAHGTCYATVVA